MIDWILHDVTAFAVSLALVPAVVLLPGALSFRLALPSEWRTASPERRLGLSLLFGFSAWPVVLGLIGHAGPAAMVFVTVPVALAGGWFLLRATPRLTASFRVGTAAAAFAVATAGALFYSLPWATPEGLLYHTVVWDAQKHAAVTRMIIETGAPPRNLSWTLEAPETGFPPLGYYWQFYNLLAVVSLLSGGIVEARDTVFPIQPWLVLALHVLLLEILRAIAPASHRPRLRSAAAAALPFVGGFWPEILRSQGIWPNTTDHFVLLFQGVSWVPQHYAAGLSAIFGLLLLARACAPDGKADPRLGLVAAMALSNALASSAPVGAVAGAAGCIFLLHAVLRRDARTVRLAGTVGAGAVVLALPVVVTLLATHGAVHEGKGLAFATRNPPIISAMESLAFAPINAAFFYVVFLGIFALGAVVCLTRCRSRLRPSPELAILGTATVASFLLATFVESNVLSNDFGWRAVIPAVIVLVALTIVAVEDGAALTPALRQAFVLAFMLGLSDTFLSMALQLRTFQDNIPERNPGFRTLWEEIDRRTAADAVVQVRPQYEPFMADQFLRTRPTALGDAHHAVVYGRSVRESLTRKRSIDPLFTDTTLSLEDARRLARRFRIDFVAVENVDPVRNAPEAWPQTARLFFETPNFRVYDLRE